MKKCILFFSLILIFLSCAKDDTSKKEDKPRLGVTLYKFDDTFISTVKNSIEDINKKKDNMMALNFADGQGQQATQNDSIDTFIAQNYDVLAVNMVDRTSAPVVIEKAKNANIPIIFFNREPVAEDMALWDNIYYVGAKAEESGRIQGEAAVKYFRENTNADKNKDGVIQYVMLTGEPGHQDAILRTEYSVKAIEEAGMKTEKLAEDTGLWQRVNGQEKMTAFLAAYGDNIELVLSNNDDMALGAIEALKAQGYFKNDKYIPVIGVDATAPALDSIENGFLYATVLNDGAGMGKAIHDIAEIKITDGNLNDLEYTLDDGKYVWIPYVPVTRDNYTNFK